MFVNIGKNVLHFVFQNGNRRFHRQDANQEEPTELGDNSSLDGRSDPNTLNTFRSDALGGLFNCRVSMTVGDGLLISRGVNGASDTGQDINAVGRKLMSKAMRKSSVPRLGGGVV